MNIIVKMHDRARVIETTRMDLHSGIMLEDDFLDISDYLNQGVLLERSVFITTSDDMQLLKRAVTIIEPDELDAIDGVYADGKPILVRTEDGSRLAPAIFEVLFDDSGNYLGDHGQGLCIYYESGSYETIVPTVLSFGDGMLMADDLIDWSDLDSGITWTRGTWTRGDRNLMELRPEPTVVVDPEQYAHMELMTFGGALVAMKTAGGMVSGGGTVSDDPDADDAETESEPQPSQDAETDGATADAAEDVTDDRASAEDGPDTDSPESTADTAGDGSEADIDLEPGGSETESAEIDRLEYEYGLLKKVEDYRAGRLETVTLDKLEESLDLASRGRQGHRPSDDPRGGHPGPYGVEHGRECRRDLHDERRLGYDGDAAGNRCRPGPLFG